MGIIKTGSRIFGKIIKEKRLLVILAVSFTSLIFGLILGGCQPMASTVIPKCGDFKDDLLVSLPDLEQDLEGVIKADICILGGKEIYTVVTDIGQDQLKLAKEVTNPVTINRLVGYFQVQRDGKPVTEFDPPLELRVEFSSQAWASVLDSEVERPHLAYLVLKDGAWANAWVEFRAESIRVIPPRTEGYPAEKGFLYITIDTLEDPLIGGL